MEDSALFMENGSLNILFRGSMLKAQKIRIGRTYSLILSSERSSNTVKKCTEKTHNKTEQNKAKQSKTKLHFLLNKVFCCCWQVIDFSSRLAM